VTKKITTTSKFNYLFEKFIKVFNKASESGLIEFALEVPPYPASRPRVSRWGTYYGKKYQDFLNKAGTAALGYKGLKVEGPVVVFIENIVPKPKTTKREYPRGDVDNYAKGVLDVMTKSEKFWEDDDQVLILIVGKRFAEPDEEPRVNLYWAEI